MFVTHNPQFGSSVSTSNYCTALSEYSTQNSFVKGENHPGFVFGQLLRNVVDKTCAVISNVFGWDTSEDAVLNSVKAKSSDFTKASCDLQKNRDFVLKAVRINGKVLEYACEFQNDRDVVDAAVNNDPEALQFASRELQLEFQDPEERITVGTHAQQQLNTPQRVRVGKKDKVNYRSQEGVYQNTRSGANRVHVGNKGTVQDPQEERVQIKRK